MSDQQSANQQSAADIDGDTKRKRKAALKLIEKKRAFWRFVGVWLLVSAGCVVIWLFSGGGLFWPVWVFLAMGIGVVSMGFGTFGKRRAAPSEAEIQREINKM
jgi:4-hydroxybenzoate polyprenyltransferase